MVLVLTGLRTEEAHDILAEANQQDVETEGQGG
jgi:hypothetical protein